MGILDKLFPDGEVMRIEWHKDFGQNDGLRSCEEMINKYKSWNKYERKYFWYSLFYTTSIIYLVINWIRVEYFLPFKLGVITILILFYVYIKRKTFDSLQIQEEIDLTSPKVV